LLIVKAPLELAQLLVKIHLIVSLTVGMHQTVL